MDESEAEKRASVAARLAENAMKVGGDARRIFVKAFKRAIGDDSEPGSPESVKKIVDALSDGEEDKDKEE